MKNYKLDIKKIDDGTLTDILENSNFKKFRKSQIKTWLFKKNVNSFEKMTNLSKELKRFLSKKFDINSLEIISKSKSSDGTNKYLFKLHQGNEIEGVLIPSNNRVTACVSSQAGCSLDCSFCATGKLELKKNLDFYEIYEQIFVLNKESHKIYNKKLNNIVYMGMGEPLLNYKNVIQSIRLACCPNEGLGISPKRITISTSGISKMIDKLAHENLRCNLALSLHSADDEIRSSLMKINDSNNVESLSKSMKYFYEQTKIRPTIEYTLLKGVNDKISDANKLASFCKNFPTKINIIEYNKIDNGLFEKSTPSNTEAFINYIKRKNIPITYRISKGKDIKAACGQLVNDNK